MAAIDDLIAEAQGQAEVPAVSGIDALIAEPDDRRERAAAIYEHIIFSDDDVEKFAPIEDAEQASFILEGLERDHPGIRVRTENRFMLSHLFDIPLEQVQFTETAVLKKLYGEALSDISSSVVNRNLKDDSINALREVPENLKIGIVGMAASALEAIKRRAIQLAGGGSGIFSDEAVKRQFEAFTPSPTPEAGGLAFGQDRLDSIRRDFLGTPRRLPGTLTAEAIGVVTRLPDMGAKIIRSKQRELQQEQDIATMSNSPITKLSRLVVQSGIPSVAVAAGASILTGNPLVGLVILGETEGGAAFQRQLDEGGSIRKSLIIGELSEAAEIAGESLVFPKLLKGLEKGISLKGALVLVGENATQEGVTGFMQSFLEVYGTETTNGTPIKEAAGIAFEAGIKAIPENAFVGGVTAGAVNLASTLTSIPAKRKARNQFKRNLTDQGVSQKNADIIAKDVIDGDGKAAEDLINKMNDDMKRRAFTGMVAAKERVFPAMVPKVISDELEAATVAELEPTELKLQSEIDQITQKHTVRAKTVEVNQDADVAASEVAQEMVEGTITAEQMAERVAVIEDKRTADLVEANIPEGRVATIEEEIVELKQFLAEQEALEGTQRDDKFINKLSKEITKAEERLAVAQEEVKPPTITDRQLLDERKAITSTPAKKRTPTQIKRVTEIEDELVLRHADEVPDIDITPKTRNVEIKKVQDQIIQSGPYQAALDAIGDLPDLSGSFNVDSTEIGDIRDRFEGRPDILKKFDLVETGGRRWDSQHDELGLPQDTTLDEFMDKIELVVDSEKSGKGLINEAALAQALNDAQGPDAAFDIELFALKHDMLKNGFTAAEINKEVQRHAEENDVDLADLEADLISLQEITDVGKKQQILRELDRTIKADKVKKISDPEKVAIEKARKIAAKTKKPTFVREKDGKFTATKLEPRKGDFIKITPAAPGKLKGKLERLKGKPKGPPLQTREAKLLILRIGIAQKKKGLTNKAFSDLKMEHGGSRRLTGRTPRTEEQLREILKAIERARPKQIGHKKVITPKTERQIPLLKDNLTKAGLMNDEAFDDILGRETGGKLPKYINSNAFITQREGRNVINRMHDIAERLRATESFDRSIVANSEIAIEHDKLKPTEHVLGAKSPSRLLSMRFFTQRLSERTGEPIYHIWQDLTFAHQNRLRERRKLLNSLEELPGFTEIARSEQALQRISDFIASQSNLANKPKSPDDITTEEKAIAKRVQEIFKLYQLQARLGKFFEHKENLSEMPQYLKHKKAIDKALEIYDTEGFDPLIEYLKTQPWGIIRSGYEPTESVIRKVSTHRMPDIAIGKSHIKVRGIQYVKQDRNILQRLDAYMRQMDTISFLQPKIKALVRTVDDVLEQFDEPSKVGSAISVYLDNLKRTNYEEGLVEEVLRKIYSQSITTLVLADPTKPVRNLLQNLAFAEDRKDFLNPENKKLTSKENEYLETFVHQDRVMLSDWAFVGEEPLNLPIIGQKRLGLASLSKWVQRHTLYPGSDRLNRTASFWAKTNRIKKAFAKNVSLAKKMKEARFSDMQKQEQQLALGILARDGVDAMTRYVAKVHTDNTHFLYAREQRSPAEQTKLGKMVLNLALFKRAALEKAALQIQKTLETDSSFENRKRAALVFVNLMAWSIITNLLWKTITGKKFGAYDFINFLEFEAGGLQLSAVETITDVYNSMLKATKGDSKALAALTVAIPKAGDMFIPFYDLGLRAIEATLGTKNIDRAALKKIREAIDSEYKSRGVEKVNRDLVEKLQFVLAKSKPDEKKKKAQRIE